MAQRGSTSVAIKGLGDKRNITVTFVVSLSGEFFTPSNYLFRENKGKLASISVSQSLFPVTEPQALVQQAGDIEVDWRNHQPVFGQKLSRT